MFLYLLFVVCFLQHQNNRILREGNYGEKKTVGKTKRNEQNITDKVTAKLKKGAIIDSLLQFVVYGDAKLQTSQAAYVDACLLMKEQALST